MRICCQNLYTTGYCCRNDTTSSSLVDAISLLPFECKEVDVDAVSSLSFLFDFLFDPRINDTRWFFEMSGANPNRGHCTASAIQNSQRIPTLLPMVCPMWIYVDGKNPTCFESSPRQFHRITEKGPKPLLWTLEARNGLIRVRFVVHF